MKSNISIIPKIGTYANDNSYFLPYIIHRYLTYVYHSTYLLVVFFNHGNYKKLGLTSEHQQLKESSAKYQHRTEAKTTEPFTCRLYHPVPSRYCYLLNMQSVLKIVSPAPESTTIISKYQQRTESATPKKISNNTTIVVPYLPPCPI